MNHSTKHSVKLWVQTRDLPNEAGAFNPISQHNQIVLFENLPFFEIFILKFD